MEGPVSTLPISTTIQSVFCPRRPETYQVFSQNKEKELKDDLQFWGTT